MNRRLSALFAAAGVFSGLALPLSAAAFVAPVIDCGAPLKAMIAASDYAPLKENAVPAAKLSLDVEIHENDRLLIHLSDTRQTPSPDSPGAGKIGIVTYDRATKKLQATGPDEDHPLTLTTDPALESAYRTCRAKSLACQKIADNTELRPFIAMSPKWRVIGKGRAHFYTVPAEQCRDDNRFVIPGDVLQVVGLRTDNPQREEKKGFLLVGYGDVSGWIETDRLEPYDEQCETIAAKAEKSFTKERPEGKMTSVKYSVTRKKLYFYDAPDKQCARKSKPYVIEKDAVWVSHKKPVNGYYHVRYINQSGTNVTEGWLPAAGLTKG